MEVISFLEKINRSYALKITRTNNDLYVQYADGNEIIYKKNIYNIQNNLIKNNNKCIRECQYKLKIPAYLCKIFFTLMILFALTSFSYLVYTAIIFTSPFNGTLALIAFLFAVYFILELSELNEEIKLINKIESFLYQGETEKMLNIINVDLQKKAKLIDNVYLPA